MTIELVNQAAASVVEKYETNLKESKYYQEFLEEKTAENALMAIIAAGDINAAKELMEQTKEYPELRLALVRGNNEDLSPISLAAKKENLEILSLLFDTLPNNQERCNFIRDEDYIMVSLAIQKRNLPLVQFTLSWLPEHEKLDVISESLSDATKSGNLPLVKFFVESLPEEDLQDVIHHQNDLAFTEAAKKGHRPILDYLLEVTPTLEQKENMARKVVQDGFKEAMREKHLSVISLIFETLQDPNEQQQILAPYFNSEHHTVIKSLNFAKAISTAHIPTKQENFNQWAESAKEQTASKSKHVRAASTFTADFTNEDKPSKKLKELHQELVSNFSESMSEEAKKSKSGSQTELSPEEKQKISKDAVKKSNEALIILVERSDLRILDDIFVDHNRPNSKTNPSLLSKLPEDLQTMFELEQGMNLPASISKKDATLILKTTRKFLGAKPDTHIEAAIGDKVKLGNQNEIS